VRPSLSALSRNNSVSNHSVEAIPHLWCALVPSPKPLPGLAQCRAFFRIESPYADRKWIADVEFVPTGVDWSQIAVLGRQRYRTESDGK
jgi:hypothetical protein